MEHLDTDTIYKMSIREDKATCLSWLSGFIFQKTFLRPTIITQGKHKASPVLCSRFLWC